MSLKLYSALIKKDANHKIEDIALIKENFSILALFFHVAWFLCHKMWRTSLILVIIEYILLNAYSAKIIDGVDLIFLQLALLLLVALNANHWYRQYLRKKGYGLTAFVLAQNEEEARLKAMKSLHRNSPDLSFDEISEEIIDPKAYLKSMNIGNGKKNFGL
ncbi:MAG TPA: hypothetical protein DIW50_12530 [Prolixibacteraceae bacterium]|nr:hypothetical protein [Prolixibacteraceae bacterium]